MPGRRKEFTGRIELFPYSLYNVNLNRNVNGFTNGYWLPGLVATGPMATVASGDLLA